MRLIGADPHTPMTGEDRPVTSTNYFIGNDPKRWRANVPTYRRVKAKNVGYYMEREWNFTRG